MDVSTLLGSTGVFLLLFAYAMNLAGKWREDSVVYLAANVLGSALSAYASYLIAYLPFVVLELTWCAVSAIKLATVFRKS